MNIPTHLSVHRDHARAVWRTLYVNWFIRLAHKFILILFILSIGILVWRWPLLPPRVPLWYSRPWGTDQLAAPYWLFLLPIAGITIYLINSIVSIYYMAEYLIFTQMLFLSSLIVNLLSFMALIKIIFLIT